MDNSYEKHFELIQDKAIIISDLMEQIILVEDVITRHRERGSVGLEIDQYIERRDEFRAELNMYLMPYRMSVVLEEAA